MPRMATSAYERVKAVIDKTPIRMLGDHNEFGGPFEFRDNNNMKVGEVNFSRTDDFMGGTWYGHVIVAGRTTTQRAALNAFIDAIEATHG